VPAGSQKRLRQGGQRLTRLDLLQNSVQPRTDERGARQIIDKILFRQTGLVRS